MIQKFTIYLVFLWRKFFSSSYFLLLNILHRPFEMRNVVNSAPVFVSVCRWHTWNAYRWQNIWGIHAIWLENAFEDDDDDDDDGDIMHIVMKALSKLFSPSQCQIYLGSHGACVCEREFGARWSSFIRFFISCMWFNWFISISSKLKRWKIIIFMCCTVCHQRLSFPSIPFHIASIRLHKLKFHFIIFKYSLSTENYIVHLVYVCVCASAPNQTMESEFQMQKSALSTTKASTLTVQMQ